MLTVGGHQNGPVLIRYDLVFLVDGLDMEADDPAAGLPAQAFFHRRHHAGNRILEAYGIGELHLTAKQADVAAIEHAGLAHQPGADELACIGRREKIQSPGEQLCAGYLAGKSVQCAACKKQTSAGDRTGRERLELSPG